MTRARARARGLVLLLALVPPTLLGSPAGAHAFLVAQFPTDGQIIGLSSDPTTIQLDWNEKVTVDPAGAVVRDGSAAVVSGPASTAPSTATPEASAAPSAAPSASAEPSLPTRVSVSSTSPLPAGRYALETSVLSKDGHQLVKAYGFAVGPAGTSAPGAELPLELAATDGVEPPLTVTFDGAGLGTRTVRVPMPDGVTGGEVRLTCRRAPGERVPKVRAPFLWKLGAPEHGVAAGTGLLPVPCAYTVRVTLERAFPASPTSYVSGPGGGLSVGS